MHISNAEPLPSSPAALNVWLVDDNKGVRSALKELLGLCKNVRCTSEFHSPNAVLSALASRPGPDAILLDIQMGEANGLDAIRPIKALSRSTQVLMFTTCFDSESKKRAFTNGASDFLLKNFPLERILDCIQRASENPAPHLKRSRAKGLPSASAVKPAANCRPRKPSSWIEQCLNRMLHRASLTPK
jgi:DNA-binding NarL/FixJ family response regulator